MTQNIILTIILEVPDGTQVLTGQPTPAAVDTPPPVSEFPPFPTGTSNSPNCPVHHSPMRAGKGGGWFCPKKIGNDWCQEKIAA